MNSEMKGIRDLLLILVIVSSTYGFILKDSFSACHTDLDCLRETEATGNDHRCFKFLCLAWNTTEVPDETGTSKHACYDHWDCVKGMVCLKHEDDAIDKGFCIEELAEMSQCVDNNDCSDGLVCVPPGSCGDPSYLAILQQLPCQDDAECWEERGDKCCYDFSEFNGQTLNSVGRRCCQYTNYVIPPDNGYNITDDLLDELEAYGDCLTLVEDDENSSKCSHNITTVVAELGLTSEDIGLEMWPQGLTATDPSSLTAVPPSKASPKTLPGILVILPYLLVFADKR